MEKTKKMTTYKMALIALMTALLCILGPLSLTLPFTPVPVSLATLAIYLAAFVLGWKGAGLSCLLYLLLGLLGIPVFSGYSAGAGKLFGPTGGYLAGYLFLALISGWFIETFQGKWHLHFIPAGLMPRLRAAGPLLGMLLGTLALYLLGTGWLAYTAGMTFQKALMAGVIPFIPGDLAKMAIALGLGPTVQKRCKKAGLM